MDNCAPSPPAGLSVPGAPELLVLELSAVELSTVAFPVADPSSDWFGAVAPSARAPGMALRNAAQMSSRRKDRVCRWVEVMRWRLLVVSPGSWFRPLFRLRRGRRSGWGRWQKAGRIGIGRGRGLGSCWPGGP